MTSCWSADIYLNIRLRLRNATVYISTFVEFVFFLILTNKVKCANILTSSILDILYKSYKAAYAVRTMILSTILYRYKIHSQQVIRCIWFILGDSNYRITKLYRLRPQSFVIIAPLLKKVGAILDLPCPSIIPLFCNSVTISFLLNILRTNGQNLTKICIHIGIYKI